MHKYWIERMRARDLRRSKEFFKDLPGTNWALLWAIVDGSAPKPVTLVGGNRYVYIAK